MSIITKQAIKWSFIHSICVAKIMSEYDERFAWPKPTVKIDPVAASEANLKKVSGKFSIQLLRHSITVCAQSLQ